MVEVKTANQLEDLKELLTSGGDVSIAVAYLTRSGLEEIKEPLLEAVSKGKKVRVVADLNSGITETETLRELMALSRDKGNNFKFKGFFNSKAIFHGKVFVAHSKERNFIAFLTGSYNLTASAFHRNWEHGLLIKAGWKGGVGKKTLDAFNKVWRDKSAKTLDDQVIHLYGKFRNEVRRKRGNSEKIQSARSELLEYLNQKDNSVGNGYWLIKCNISAPYITEPERKYYKFSDLLAKPNKTDYWGNEVNNEQARNYLEKNIKEGDEVFFYHSGIRQPEIVGVVRVVREAYPSPDGSGKMVVDIKAIQKFHPPVTLREIKENFFLEDMILVKGSTRLSIQPVKPEEYEEIVHRIGKPRQVSTI